ncbi:OprD family porin [Stutzerimonas nitrititolerans]|uniref:OprD family porin n=1 Tax=Stutzerimonas nitrititolerans TaxID=2482751 RepID=UPI002896F37A|nr:OprD family porin [Stutzerimonas nitrititolerans]
MTLSKKRLLVLAIATGSPLALASQTDSNGFIEDGRLDFLTRNLYWNHDRKNGAEDRREWGQGFRLDYRSGYSRGTVGFGVDASAYAALKLDGGRGYSNAVMMPDDGNGGTEREASSAGAAVKLRISATELKYGNNLRPYNPVFAAADARLVPGTATGLHLTSNELEGLSLEAAHLTAAKDFNSTNGDDDFHAAYAGVSTSTVNFLGGSYVVNDRFSFSLYGSEFEDIWRQYYANANYVYPINENQSLTFDFNLYKTDDEGRKLAGDIDTTAYSLAAAWSVGAHTFKLAYQKNEGDTPFDYLGLGPGTFHDSIYLANSSQIVDFNGPNEKSWGLFYDLELSRYGVPGLSIGARYIKGSDVDGSKMDAMSPYNYYGDKGSEEHWERGFDIRYAVQQGSARGLSFRLRQATHRIGNGASDISSDQVRLIVEYPYQIF